MGAPRDNLLRAGAGVLALAHALPALGLFLEGLHLVRTRISGSDAVHGMIFCALGGLIILLVVRFAEQVFAPSWPADAVTAWRRRRGHVVATISAVAVLANLPGVPGSDLLHLGHSIGVYMLRAASSWLVRTLGTDPAAAGALWLAWLFQYHFISYLLDLVARAARYAVRRTRLRTSGRRRS